MASIDIHPNTEPSHMLDPPNANVFRGVVPPRHTGRRRRHLPDRHFPKLETPLRVMPPTRSSPKKCAETQMGRGPPLSFHLACPRPCVLVGEGVAMPRRIAILWTCVGQGLTAYQWEQEMASKFFVDSYATCNTETVNESVAAIGNHQAHAA